MGSLALVFGLLFFIGLAGGLGKVVSRREGAYRWLASAGLGLVLYGALIAYAAGWSGPGGGAPAGRRPPRRTGVAARVYTPRPGTGVPAENSMMGTPVYQPPRVPAERAVGPNIYTPKPQVPPRTTVRAVYGGTPAKTAG